MDGQTIEPQLTFAGHVHELRRRLTWPALFLVVGGTIAYLIHNRIIAFLQAPLHQTLYYSNPAGGFNFIMKICFIVGITLAIPALIYHLISFIEPAVGKKVTRQLITLVTVLSLFLGLAGAAFAYYGALPMSLHFFGNININGVKPLLQADDYLNFTLTCILTFILLFQLPLIVLFINHIKPMSPRKLLKYEKYVIVGSLAIALILPFSYDPLTQFLIAVPIILLYNLSIMFVVLANRRTYKERRKARRAEARAQKKVAKEPPVVVVEPHSEPVTATIEALPPAPKPEPIRPTFIEPVLQQRPVPQPIKRRPVFDVSARPLQAGPGNFLDLRPNK